MKLLLVQTLLLTFFLFNGKYTCCQNPDRPLRIEISVNKDNQPYKVIPLGKQGVLLFYRAATVNDKSENRWIISLLDINLNPSWTRDFPLPDEYEYKFFDDSYDTLFIGFQDSDKKGGGTKAALVVVDIRSGFLKMDEELLPDKHDLINGKLIKGYLVLALKDKNDKLTLLIRNTGGSYRASFPLETAGKTYLDGLIPRADGSGFLLVFKEFETKKESNYLIRSFNFRGKQQSEVKLDFSLEESNVNTVKTFPVDSARQLILGTYSSRKNANFSETENRIEESTGFFGAWSVSSTLKSHNLYNFLNFKNFFNRLRGSQSVYEGKNLKKEKEISSDYRVLLHDIIKHQQEYILIGEAYYPEYHTVTNWTYDYYGHMIPNYYTVFDGYRYNNAFICGFDSTGKMLWENSLEINNILTMNLKKRINAFFDGQEIILSYLAEGKIAYKVINRDQTLNGIEYINLENLDEHDKVIENSDGIFSYWYDNYFIAYGYQEIKNLTRADTRRTVFYLSKIVFR